MCKGIKGEVSEMVRGLPKDDVYEDIVSRNLEKYFSHSFDMAGSRVRSLISLLRQMMERLRRNWMR
jgi:hypothetical protein